jgi:Ca2+-binding RTX toxin-like protein
LTACAVGEQDVDQIVDDAAALGADPCKSLKATVKHVQGDAHRFVGTNARDIIIATPGDDVIFGNGGDDVICGLGGDDYIDGGNGRDAIFAGPGADIVHGRAGSDRIFGGPGPDTLFGDTLDDQIFGQEGNDVLIGGHGTDVLDGGNDNDFLRGDTGNDTFDGGAGYDIASFATALPPGQPEVKADGSDNPIDGIAITMGSSDGDGGNEPVRDIEQITGSPFTDRINGVVDTPVPLGQAYVDVTKKPNGDIAEVGVIVLGTDGPDNLSIVGNDNHIVNIRGGVTAGTGCTQTTTGVRCDLGNAPFRFVSVWGGKGADTIEIVGDFPREFEAHASGGEGSDHLMGGEQQDVFFTGISGNDHLEGRGGDDALIGESHHTLKWADGDRPEAAQYDDGADIFDGGEGNDQLVVDYVCGGHRYIGGPGFDIAGFARSGKHAINAQLGGPAKTKTQWWGFAANMDLCGSLQNRWTSFRTGEGADLEVLEASDGPDNLWGDDGPNVIWSRGGGDRVYALGGDDEIRGADGRDVLDGGSGKNTITWGEQ